MTIKSITIKLDDDLLDEANKAIEYFNKEKQRKHAMTKSSVVRSALIDLVKKYKRITGV